MLTSREDTWKLDFYTYDAHMSKAASSPLKDIFIQPWKSRCSKRIKFLIWESARSCLNMVDRLQKRCPWFQIYPSWCLSLQKKTVNQKGTFSSIASLLLISGLLCFLLSVGMLLLFWALLNGPECCSLNTPFKASKRNSMGEYCLCCFMEDLGWPNHKERSSKEVLHLAIFNENGFFFGVKIYNPLLITT